MGLRRFFQQLLPDHGRIRQHRQLRFLGRILHDPDIFHLTRRSTAGGVATGLFVGFLPIPGQMLVSALAAILFRVNLPLAVVLVWISNPLTMPPLFFLSYRIGTRLLGHPHESVHFEMSLQWLATTFMHIWPPVLAGCLLLGTVAGAAGYVGVRLLWRLAVVRKMEERRISKAGRRPPG
jgi:uncharacterized protein (DUF2062 family)